MTGKDAVTHEKKTRPRLDWGEREVLTHSPMPRGAPDAPLCAPGEPSKCSWGGAHLKVDPRCPAGTSTGKGRPHLVLRCLYTLSAQLIGFISHDGEMT